MGGRGAWPLLFMDFDWISLVQVGETGSRKSSDSGKFLPPSLPSFLPILFIGYPSVLTLIDIPVFFLFFYDGFDYCEHASLL
jgi:hypothetical protein